MAILPSGSGRTLLITELCTPASTTTPYGQNNTGGAVNAGDLLLYFIVNKAVNSYSFLFPPDNGTSIGTTGQILATALPAPSSGALIMGAFPARASAAINSVQATVFITTGGVSAMRWYSIAGGGRAINTYANVQGSIAAFPPSAYNINTRTRSLATSATLQGYTRTNTWMQFSSSGGAVAPAVGGGGIFASAAPWSRFGIFGSTFFGPATPVLGTGVMAWFGAGAPRSGYADITAPNIALGVSLAGHYLFTAVSIPSSG